MFIFQGHKEVAPLKYPPAILFIRFRFYDTEGNVFKLCPTNFTLLNQVFKGFCLHVAKKILLVTILSSPFLRN